MDSKLPSLASARRIVVKIGSALVVEEKTAAPRTAWLASVAADVAALRAHGKEVLLVSSGAISLARRALGLTRRALRLEEKQAAQTQDFAQAEKAVTSKLMTQKREAKLQEIRNQLGSKYDVTVNWDKVNDIKVGSGVAAPGRPGSAPTPVPIGQRPRTVVPAEQPPAKK